MRSGSSTAASLLLLLLQASDSAHAITLPRAQAGQGYLSVPVNSIPKHKNRKAEVVSKRAGSAINAKLENEDFFYSAQVGIGNPPQGVTILVDTGSSELWVNPDCDNAGATQLYDQCKSFGSYNPKKSKDAIGPFGHEQLNYGDASDASTQTTVEIDYYADDIAIGDATIKNQTFGKVTESEEVSQGIMGLGPDLDGGYSGEKPYSLLLNSMADQGIISSKVFSLDLRHADEDTGAVVYGGIDRNRFIGSFQKQDLVRGTQGEYRLATTLTTIGLTVGGKSQSFKLSGDDQTVLLDSGTTISRMHNDVAYPILQALGAQDDGEGNFITSCDSKDAGGSLDVGFGDKIIHVPFKDFVIDLAAGSEQTSSFCLIGLVTTEDLQILGDTVLRAGYFVFDWDNEQIHIAQAATCGDGNDILTVGSGDNAVPSSTGNCPSSDATFTGGTPTATRGDPLPTSAFTTTYMVSSCLPFERGCATGVMTTQTVGPDADATVTSAGSRETGTDGGGDDDSAGGRARVGWGVVGGVAGLALLGVW